MISESETLSSIRTFLDEGTYVDYSTQSTCPSHRMVGSDRAIALAKNISLRHHVTHSTDWQSLVIIT